VSNFIRSLVLFLFIMIFASYSNANIIVYELESELEQEQQNDFIAGQVWSYATRQHEKGSKLTVLKVDYFENAVVVHIRLDNIKLMDPNVPRGVRTTVSHMAFLQTALEQSVIKLINKNKRLPEFSKEYQNWREGDGIGTAWAWHFSVSEALNGLERIYVNKQQSSLIEKDQSKNN